MNSRNTTVYYIETGRENKYYTLWVHRDNANEASVEKGINFWSYDKYLRNLSVDKEEAIAKAMEITGLAADQLEICEHKTGKIVYEEDALRFGKYKDKRVSELEDVKWLNWLAKGGMVPSKYHQGEYEQCSPVFKNPMLIDFAQDRLIQLGEWQTFNGKKISNAKADLLNKGAQFGKELKFGHHFLNGDKMKSVRLSIIHETSYDSMYGTTYVITLMDEEKRVYTYKGNSSWYSPNSSMSELVETPEGNKWQYYEVDIVANFSIEHSTYNDIPQTLIRRPKTVEFIKITEEASKEMKKLYSNYKQILKLA